MSERQKAYILTKPLHDSQVSYRGASEEQYRKLYPCFYQGAFFSIKCIENYELIRELCSYGSDLVVLSPMHIRDKVSDRVEAMLKEYRRIREYEG